MVALVAGFKVQPALPEQRLALTQFYKSNQYKGKVKATDNMWVMINVDDQIIGAARLCQQAGFTLLRGVWIDKALRAQGLGSQLLQHLKCVGALEGCYCFSYLHLESFYLKHGFCQVARTPAPLHSALERYNRQKEQVVLMRQQVQLRSHSHLSLGRRV